MLYILQLNYGIDAYLTDNKLYTISINLMYDNSAVYQVI